VTVTERLWTVVMLEEDGVRVTVGVSNFVSPVPLSPMLCVTAGLAFRLLSVRTADPEINPVVVGMKSTARLQLPPAASVPAEDEVRTSGQVVDESRVKLAETLGFVPVPGTGKVSGALPILRTVTLFGLSLLCEPSWVLAKLKLGGVATVSLASVLPTMLVT
jgi:hypothetical protein